MYILKTIQKSNKIKCFSYFSLHLWKLDASSLRRACLCSHRAHLSVAMKVLPVLLAVLATPTRITGNNPGRGMEAYRLSSIGRNPVKSLSPHPRGTPDVTGLNADL
jgi:hypothetical protein